jgi:hypothetical protein
MHRGARMRMVVRTLPESVGPKAGAVLAGIGLYVVVADTLGVIDALLRPLDINRPDVSVVGAVTYVAPALLALLAGVFAASLFVGWLSGRRGWLYGLATALCLSFPESALALRTLTLLPIDSFGVFGSLSRGWSWAALASIPSAWCVFGLVLLSPFGGLLLAALGGYCGERVRLRRSGDSST